MEEVEKLLQGNPQATSINLELLEIDDLSPIMRGLEQFSALEELLLFGNRIQALPQDMSGLRKLKVLDISNNLVTRVDNVIPGLRSLPSLQELVITLASDADEATLKSRLPGLLKLNDKTYAEEPQMLEIEESLSFSVDSFNLKQKDLERIAVVYDQIRALWRKHDAKTDKKLAADFDVHVRSVMASLSGLLKKEKPSASMQATMVKAKYDLAEICSQKLTQFMKRYDSQAATILTEIQEYNEDIIKQLCDLVVNLNAKAQDKIKALGQDLEKAALESAQVLEVAERLEREIEGLKKDRDNNYKTMEQERSELMAEIETLQDENRKYLDKIIKHSKSAADHSLLTRAPTENSTPTLPTRVSNPAKPVMTTRTLTLKQLKETIKELYESKTRFDAKCAEGKQPIETLEQHMYTFLNTKYGLKNLVIEWAASIIQGIKKFSFDDNDIAVFGKILRNECDEEFRFVQIQVKETVSELLKYYIRERHPLKQDTEINEMLKAKQKGSVLEEEWSEIVRYMYNDADSDLLIKVVRQLIDTNDLVENRSKPKTREEVRAAKASERHRKGSVKFKDFLKVLLDFQLKGHEKFLAPFIVVFRSVDRDDDGLISEQEFRRMVVLMEIGLHEDDVSRLLQAVDPFNTQQIPFTKCVASFSSVRPIQELVSSGEGDEQITILQRLNRSE